MLELRSKQDSETLDGTCETGASVFVFT